MSDSYPCIITSPWILTCKYDEISLLWLFVVVVQSLYHVRLFCDFMECSIPVFPVLHHLVECVQIHVHWVSNAVYHILCHPLLPLPLVFPSIRIFSNELALPIRWPKYWSFIFIISPSMNIQGCSLLGLTGLISLLSKGRSRVFSNTRVQKYQFFSDQPSLWYSSLIQTWLLGKL